MIETDVLVAGGGPCGLMLANELGRRGIRCLVVDAKPGTAFNPQANATQARTMEHFRRLGFAQEIRALGLPADHPTDIAYLTRYAGHELARISLPTAAEATVRIKTMTGSWSAAELPHRVSQKFVEQTLHRHAQAWPWSDVRYGWKLEGFRDDGESVRATVRHIGEGRAQEVRAQFLMGADGGRSFVRQQLGIEWGGVTGIRREFMGGKMFAIYLRAPQFLSVLRHPKAWMYVAVNHQRRAFMASVDGVAEYAFHAALRPGEDADGWTEADARRVFAEAVGAEVPMEILSMGTWLAGHALVAQRYRQGRVFIGGDAAHLFTPTGGLGYNTAVEDAVNLGWKLASVVRGHAPLALLDSYEAERKPLAERNTGFARRFADSVGLYIAKPELEEDSAQGVAERQVASKHLNEHARLEFNIPGVTFGGRYDSSPIIVRDGATLPPDEPNHYVPTASPGGRPPHAWLDDGRSLFDLFHAEWTLLALGASPPPTDAFEAAARARAIDLRVVRLPQPSLLDLYEVSNGARGVACLVRGSVRGAAGEPVAHAHIDVWQSDEDGLYDVQHAGIDHTQARGILNADAQGRYHFRSILAVPYAIPHDGPVGDLLKATGRHPWRPAHLHFMIKAEGYETLITHVFRSDGPYLDSDAVFGVRQSLIADWAPQPDGTYLVEYDFVLNPAG